MNEASYHSSHWSRWWWWWCQSSGAFTAGKKIRFNNQDISNDDWLLGGILSVYLIRGRSPLSERASQAAAHVCMQTVVRWPATEAVPIRREIQSFPRPCIFFITRRDVQIWKQFNFHAVLSERRSFRICTHIQRSTIYTGGGRLPGSTELENGCLLRVQYGYLKAQCGWIRGSFSISPNRLEVRTLAAGALSLKINIVKQISFGRNWFPHCRPTVWCGAVLLGLRDFR